MIAGPARRKASLIGFELKSLGGYNTNSKPLAEFNPSMSLISNQREPLLEQH